MRLAQNGGMRDQGVRDERQKGEEEKIRHRQGAYGLLMGTPRAVVGAARAVVVGTLSGSQ